MEGSEVGGSARDDMVASPTKTGFASQARGNWAQGVRLALGITLLGGLLGACSGQVAEGRDCPAAQRARSVSGFCVPRYVSLKRGEVFGRKGPGKDYPALWIYHVRGLPVQVVAETSEWRRICDPDGGAVWVNRAMIDGRRTVMAVGPARVSLGDSPKPGAKVTGQLDPRAIASLDACRGGWCRVKAEGIKGWAPAAQFWGVAEAPQCH
jgi:SH3-like domain-containing protein